MDVTQLPFNRLVGLEPAAGDGFLVTLPAGPEHANHLGTVHASALLAVAEAGSGAFLARHPAAVTGWAAELAARGRVSAPVTVTVEVVDAAGVVVLSAVVDK